jgi:hypothetical protein
LAALDIAHNEAPFQAGGVQQSLIGISSPLKVGASTTTVVLIALAAVAVALILFRGKG